jgi:uncharacterized membrane protein
MPNKTEVTVTPKSLVVRPGETVEARAALHNLGQSIDQLNVSIEGLDNSWYNLPVSSVALFPNDKDELKIVLSAPKDSKIKAGSYPFRIKVSSQANPDETSIVDAAITVQTIPELEMSLTPPSITGRRGLYKIDINNVWDNDIQLKFHFSDTSSALKEIVQPDIIQIPAKSRAQAKVEVSLGWLSFFGGDKEFAFQILATLPDAEEGKTLEGKLVRTAWYRMLTQIRLPRIRLPGFLVSFFQRPPVIDSFQARTEDKSTFTVSWLVRKALELKLNGEAVNSQGEKTLTPAAPTTYILTATNKYGKTEKMVSVEPRVIPAPKTSDRIKASLSSNQLKLQMGGIPEIASLTLQNMGEIVDKFMVDIEGIEADWYNRSASSIALMPQTIEPVQISFQVPKKKGIKARNYPFAVIVKSQTKPDDVTILNGSIDVLPFVDYKLKVAPYRVTCRRKGTFRVGLSNTGTAEARIVLDATDLDEGLNFKFKNKEPVLAAWQGIEVPVVARPKKAGLVGDRKRFDITITAQEAGGNTQTSNGELYHNPLISSWKSIFRAIRRLIFLAIVVVIIVLLINFGGGFKLLTTSPKDWWSQVVDKIVNFFTGLFS